MLRLLFHENGVVSIKLKNVFSNWFGSVESDASGAIIVGIGGGRRIAVGFSGSVLNAAVIASFVWYNVCHELRM